MSHSCEPQTGERQNYDDGTAWDRPVQSARFTEVRQKSDTENARTVANHYGWRFNADDELTEDHGPRIAYTIEDAAAAMVELGWISRYRVNWPGHNDGRDAAHEIRERLDENGTHHSRSVTGQPEQ